MNPTALVVIFRALATSTVFSAQGKLIRLFAVILGFTQVLAQSPDIDWTIVRQHERKAFPGMLFGVTWGAGRFVAVGTEIVTSTDGVSWSEASKPTKTELSHVAYGNGRFVAVGAAYYYQSPNDYKSAIVTSTDGLNWNTVLEEQLRFDPSTEENEADFFLNDVTYADGKFVAVGRGSSVNSKVLTSTNGVTWERIPTLPRIAANRVIFHDGWWYTVGGGVARSRDARNWEQIGSWADLGSIIFADGELVAGGPGGQLFASSDCTDWSPVYSHPEGPRFWGLATGGGYTLAVGWNTILTRGSSAPWVPLSASFLDTLAATTSPTLEDIIFADNQFIVVGELGLIVRGVVPPRVVELSKRNLRNPQEFELQLSPATGRRVQIEVSENLREWRHWTNAIGDSTKGPWILTDPVEASVPKRFYRAHY